MNCAHIRLAAARAKYGLSLLTSDDPAGQLLLAREGRLRQRLHAGLEHLTVLFEVLAGAAAARRAPGRCAEEFLRLDRSRPSGRASAPWPIPVVNSTSPVFFSPMKYFFPGVPILPDAVIGEGASSDDQADEESRHAVELALRPVLEWMVVAAGALQLRAQEEIRLTATGRVFRLAAELHVETVSRTPPVRPARVRAPIDRTARSWRTCHSATSWKPSRFRTSHPSPFGGLRPKSVEVLSRSSA